MIDLTRIAGVLLLATLPSHAGSELLETLRPGDGKNADVISPTLPTSTGWTLSLSTASRSFGNITYLTNSSIGSSDSIGSFVGESFEQLSGAEGPAGQVSDRAYDNGFVNRSSLTPATGRTTNFSYTDSSVFQNVNSDGVPQQLRFLSSNAGSGRRTSLPSLSRRDIRDSHSLGSEIGLQIAASYALNEAAGFQISFETSFSAAGLDVQSTASTFDQLQEGQDFIISLSDTFDVSDVVVPGAPYTGAFEAPGQPSIPNLPIPGSRTRADRNDGPAQQVAVTNQISRDLAVNLDSLSAGLSASRTFDRFTVQLGAGITGTHAGVSGSTTERLLADGRTSRSLTTTSDVDEFLLGAYFQATASLALTSRVSAHVYGRYDWSEDLESVVGRDSFRADLSGPSVGLGMSFQF